VIDRIHSEEAIALLSTAIAALLAHGHDVGVETAYDARTKVQTFVSLAQDVSALTSAIDVLERRTDPALGVEA
jgi:hypothetical protein